MRLEPKAEIPMSESSWEVVSTRGDGQVKRGPPRAINLAEEMSSEDLEAMMDANLKDAKIGRGDRPKRGGDVKAKWPKKDPNQEEPEDCTLCVSGIPWYIEEAKLTMLLLTAFKHPDWPRNHEKIIIRNWIRERNPAHMQRTVPQKWRFSGNGYLRFANREAAEEYKEIVDGQVIGVHEHEPRNVKVSWAEKDTEFVYNKYPSGPQYYKDVWVVHEKNMEER